MLTDEEYEAFSERCKTYGMSQAEMIRQAITGVTIHPLIKISAASDELLSSVGRMTSEYGKIGSKLNQVARFLNETHTPYPDLDEEGRMIPRDDFRRETILCGDEDFAIACMRANLNGIC